MDYYIGLAIAIVILAMFAVIMIGPIAEMIELYLERRAKRKLGQRYRILWWRSSDEAPAPPAVKKETLQLAAIGVVVCLVIVAISTPVFGTLHENVKVKSFYTFICVFVLVVVGGAYAQHRRQR